MCPHRRGVPDPRACRGLLYEAVRGARDPGRASIRPREDEGNQSCDDITARRRAERRGGTMSSSFVQPVPWSGRGAVPVPKTEIPLPSATVLARPRLMDLLSPSGPDDRRITLVCG